MEVTGGLAPLKVAAGLSGQLFRVLKVSWDNQQSRHELEKILRDALAKAISREAAGLPEVREVAGHLAKRFRVAPPPESSPGVFGRVAVWTRGRIPLLPPLMADQEPIDEGGWLEEQRRWAQNALDGPEVEKELRSVSEAAGRVEVGQVIARFPEALDYELKHGESNKTKKMLLKLRAGSELAREQLDLKPRPTVVAGTTVLAGAGAVAGGYLVGAEVGVAVAIGLGIALIAGLAVALAARSPMRQTAALAVRMAAVHWVTELFDVIGPSDLRGTTPDTVGDTLRIVMSREPSPATPTGAEDSGGGELKNALGELVEDLSNRVIRRAETVADGPLLAALYTVEDHSKRVQYRWDPATLAALYGPMLDVVLVCLPPLPPSALSPSGREIARVLSVLMSQVDLARPGTSRAEDVAHEGLGQSLAQRTAVVASTASGGLAGTGDSTRAVQLAVSLKPDGRWRLPARPGAVLKAPAELMQVNWRRNKAFPGSALNELRLTDPRGGSAGHCVVGGKVDGSDPPRWLRADLHRNGSGVVTVGDLCGRCGVDLEQLTSDVVAAVQALVLHANHRAMKKGHADLEIRLVGETHGNGTQRPIQLQVGHRGPVTGTLMLNCTPVTECVNAKAVGKSITAQLVASAALLNKFLVGFNLGDLCLITDKGTPVTTAWSQRRQSAIEAWARRYDIDSAA